MISVDDLATNTAFAKEHGADYPILSDETKEVAKAYGVLSPLRLPHRWTFYIGIDGTILHVDKKVGHATAGADIAATLARLGVAGR